MENLPDIADRVLRYLQSRKTTIKAREICTAAEQVGVQLTDSGVREIIHYLRVEKGEMICSVSGKDGGYYYTTSAVTFQKCCEHLMRRGIEAIMAYKVPLQKYEQRQTIDLELSKYPLVVEALNGESK